MSKVKLYKYQEEAFNNTMEIYKSSNRACIIMATGTGKSYVMMRLLEEFDKEDGKAYILTPNNPTKEQTINKMVEYDLNNAEFGLYQTINAMTDDEIAKIDCDLIIADELHRTGATQWGKKFEHLINTHPNAKVFGVTATPIRSDGRDMAEEYFEGNKACEISLSDAIVREILPMPLYVSALYTFEEEYKNMSDKIEKGNNSLEEKAEIQKELLAAKQQLEKANGVPEIIKKYITNYNGKYIVFCKNKTHMKKMKGTVKKWFKQAGYNGKIFSYEYYSEDKDANENFNNFQNNNQEGLKLLFVIDMLNEGLHLKDINGCILLRTTGSHIVYYQQIGRVIDAGSKEQRVILDLVSNFNSLKSFNLKKELKESVRKRQLGNFSDCSEDFELEKFDVVDCVQECVDVFNNIDYEILCNDWSEKEKDILKKYYPTIGIKCKKYLNRRSEKSIIIEAGRLGLSQKRIDWSEEEIELLKKHYPHIGTKVQNKLKDKSIPSIRNKAMQLGIKYLGNIWSENDDEILKKYYPIIGCECKKYLNNQFLSNDSISNRARKLGIKYLNRAEWSKRETQILINNYMDKNIYNMLPDKTPKQIEIKRRTLKLGKRNKSSKYMYVTKRGRSRSGSDKYEVGFYIEGSYISFGLYDDEDEAGRVALEKAKEYGKI